MLWWCFYLVQPYVLRILISFLIFACEVWGTFVQVKWQNTRTSAATVCAGAELKWHT